MILLKIMWMIFILTCLILLVLNFNFMKFKKTEREKLTPFECGFDPFCSPRIPISIQFYMISIMFLIFDIEIIIFLPIIPSFYFMVMNFNLSISMFFIFILLLGLYIEWKDGALTWLK